MVEVTLHFRSPADELGPTSFTSDREHAKQRQLAAQSGQAPNRSVQVPRQVRLRDGREGYDATQAERSVVAELLGGKGRGFVLLPHESAVTDWHDADQIISILCRGTGAGGARATGCAGPYHRQPHNQNRGAREIQEPNSDSVCAPDSASAAVYTLMTTSQLSKADSQPLLVPCVSIFAGRLSRHCRCMPQRFRREPWRRSGQPTKPTHSRDV